MKPSFLTHCGMCFIWTEKDIYHCEKCGICRQKVNGKIGIHDDSKGICVQALSTDAKFRTLNINLKTNCCAICKENTFTSMRSCRITPCGHIMHDECYTEYLRRGEYKCPECSKSLKDMKRVWALLRENERRSPIPRGAFAVRVGSIVGTDFG